MGKTSYSPWWDSLVKCLQMAQPLVKRWQLWKSILAFNQGVERQRQIRFINSARRRFQHCRQKRGEQVGYSGHKHQKGEKELAIADNNGNVIAPLVVKSVNKNDTSLFPDSLEQLIETADWLCLDIFNSYLTLDSGFDSEDNKVRLSFNNLIPVIKPNPRGSGKEKRYAMLDEFELLKHIYKERYKIERSFAWQYTYRKLVIRYEKLQCTHLGFKHLAYSMINYRSFFKKWFYPIWVHNKIIISYFLCFCNN